MCIQNSGLCMSHNHTLGFKSLVLLVGLGRAYNPGHLCLTQVMFLEVSTSSVPVHAIPSPGKTRKVE